MPKALIKIAYKQVIDSASKSTFEKNILTASYEEYKMKQQAYNADGSITTFTALKAKDGRANSLHYKSGFAVGGFIETLKNKIIILQDNDEQVFAFDVFRFEILESDTTNIALHKVAIHYISATLTLFEIIGNYLLLANGDYTAENSSNSIETFLVKVQPGMTITSYQEIKNQ
jgi:hypothetical protein